MEEPCFDVLRTKEQLGYLYSIYTAFHNFQIFVVNIFMH